MDIKHVFNHIIGKPYHTFNKVGQNNVLQNIFPFLADLLWQVRK